MFSRGSILPLLIERYKQKKSFRITDTRMTRFNIELNQAINISNACMKKMIGGELFVPRLKSYKVLDLAKAINEKTKIEIIGIRPGEKLHEEMISRIDSLNTYNDGKIFIIADPLNEKLNKYYKKFKKMKSYFSYNSYDNNEYLSKKELKKIVSKYI